MQIIKINNKDDLKNLNIAPNVMTAGFFDGVHLGHQKLIEMGRKKADQLKIPLVVLTFWPYPKQFYKNIKQPYPILTTLKDKYFLFKKLKVDLVLEVEFNSEIQQMNPQEFVDYYIKASKTKVFVAGIDFTYGEKKIANMELLPKSADNSFEVEKVAFFEYEGEKISSSTIRKEIKNSQVEKAANFLGRNYITKGKVISGAQVGRTIGFPTANMDNTENYLLPGDGVYFSKVKIKNCKYWGITSVGNKPTYGNHKKYVETYILDFDSNIYGEEMFIEWLCFERPQIKFNSEDDLIKAINGDLIKMRRYIKQL